MLCGPALLLALGVLVTKSADVLAVDRSHPALEVTKKPPTAVVTLPKSLPALPNAAVAHLGADTAAAASTSTPGAVKHPAEHDLEQRLQRLQEQRRLCARCDCFALRNGTARVSLDENLDDVEAAAAASTRRPSAPTTAPPENQVLVINCTERLLAEELPRWSWPARLSEGETVAAEIWTEFRGGDLSGVARLPHLPFRLTRLSLADNRLRSVASRAFANLGSLRDLDLSNNVIADVPHDAFIGLSSLESLNISRNSLISRPLSADLFRGLDKLRRVSLAFNRLAGELNGETLPWSGSIQELDLSHNEIVSVSAGTWKRLPNIKILNLSHNRLGSMTPDAFLELRSLQRLDLSWNALTTLPPGALSGLTALASLDLSNNGLKTMPPATFQHLDNLTALDLSSNAISPQPGALAALSALPASLRSLDLSGNPLGHGEGGLEGRSELGAALPAALESLSLARCGLHEFAAHEWGGLHALRRLDVSGNDVSVLSDLAHLDALAELNASHNALTRFPAVALPALAALDLSHNQLERAPAPDAPRLAALLLDDNPMEELRLDGGVPASLAVLSARRMPQLRSLPAGAVAASNASTPPACLRLRLGSNPALAHIHEDALSGLRLCELELSHGALRWLPERLLNWSSVAVLDLQANPWHCDCRLQWMLDSVVRQLYRSEPALLEDLRCGSPGSAAGRRMVHWFNHTGRAFCDGELMDLQAAGAGGSVTLRMSPATLAVMCASGVVAVGLVALGILAHRKYLARRRARNRRL